MTPHGAPHACAAGRNSGTTKLNEIQDFRGADHICHGLQGQVEKLRLASALADANIAAHPPVHTATPTEPPSSITPPAPQSSAAPKLLAHSVGFGGAGGTNADAGVTCAVVRKLYLDAEKAQRFLATLHATQHTSLDDLPDEHLPTVERIAGSCAASCMQLWAAVIHYDVAPEIFPTLAQHPQHEQHFPPNAAPSDATKGAHGRVCKVVAAPAQEQVAHNGAQSAPTGGSVPPTGSLPPLPKDAQCSVCLLYTSPSPRDRQKSRMPSSA